MKEIHATRLLNVARALRESENPGAFTMGQYTHSCGTPACALGHYAARHDLQKTFKIGPVGESGVFTLLGRRATPWHALGYDGNLVCDHFGINEAEAEELFGPTGCGHAQTPKMAARYIERFVQKRVKATR